MPGIWKILGDVESAQNYIFEKGDITDSDAIYGLFEKYAFDAVIHLAAESHVDRSIADPLAFVKTNVMGTCNLLNICRKQWNDKLENKLFYHVSTDEVYGSLGKDGFFTETSPYDPRSPYPLQRLPRIISLWPIIIPTVYRSCCLIVQITMVPIIFRKN